MRIVNMSDKMEDVKLRNKQGQLDYIHIMPKRQVTVPDGFEIDPNWAAQHPLVKIVQEDN